LAGQVRQALLRRCLLEGFPAPLQRLGEALLHGGGDVAVDAADAAEAMAETPGLGNFGDAILDQPGFVGVA
jgi:hypothetical protein